MEKASRSISTSLIIGGLIIILVMITAGFAVLSSPKTIVSFQVSFSIGADVKNREFDMPLFHDKVQVEVIIAKGTSLWNAKITRQDKTLWDHTTSQGGQTTYKSEWIDLPRGRYNFTFATAGLGSLEADIRVTSKGGFW